jgi:hypothetical protein
MKYIFYFILILYGTGSEVPPLPITVCCLPVAGYWLQLRLQASLQIPTSQRGSPAVRKQQPNHLERRPGPRVLLRPRLGALRRPTLPHSVTELPWRLPAQRDLLLSAGTSTGAARKTRDARCQTTQQPQDTHQGSDR